MAIQNFADLVRLAKERAFYEAGGGRQSEGQQIGEALGGIGKGFNAVNEGIQQGQKTAYGQMMLEKMAQQMAPVGDMFGIARPQQATNQQLTRVAPNIYPQPTAELEGTADQQIGPANPFASQALPGQAPMAPMVRQRQDFQTSTGISPDTANENVAEMSKLSMAPLERSLKQAETENKLVANKKLLDEETKLREYQDPNSAISKSYQTMFKTMFKKETMEPASVLEKFIGSGSGELKLGEHEGQFWQKQKENFINKNNPLVAGSRNVLGMLGRANMQADRAMALLNKQNVTGAEFGNIIADMAGIFQGGAPTDVGMKHQDYNTAYRKAQEFIQFVTGHPNDVLPDGIKQTLKQDLTDMKLINRNIIKSNNDLTEQVNTDLVSKGFKPGEWQAFRQSTEGPEIQQSKQYDDYLSRFPRGTKVSQVINGLIVEKKLSREQAEQTIRDFDQRNP